LEKKTEQLDEEMKGYTHKHWRVEYAIIQSITGFGPLLTCYIIAHILPIERFQSNRKLRRYAGVVPTFHESGGKTSKGHIPKTSSRKLLRWALIQAANTAGKTDTRLGRYYRMKKKQKKNAMYKMVSVGCPSLSWASLYPLKKNGQLMTHHSGLIHTSLISVDLYPYRRVSSKRLLTIIMYKSEVIDKGNGKATRNNVLWERKKRFSLP